MTLACVRTASFLFAIKATKSLRSPGVSSDGPLPGLCDSTQSCNRRTSARYAATLFGESERSILRYLPKSLMASVHDIVIGSCC
ncbi:MAG: hypothetical protein BWY95_01304 [Bacteroidetes bacterium ADurb.BinA104]|nr:MAG: hypothetical protein BWY95_01304 [Bacteroidetes bacterium ADurb.BinA104]